MLPFARKSSLARTSAVQSDEAAALLRMEERLPPLLSVIAGMVDLTGFFTLGNIFTAHITGNLVTASAVMVRGGPMNPAQLLAIPVFLHGQPVAQRRLDPAPQASLHLGACRHLDGRAASSLGALRCREALDGAVEIGVERGIEHGIDEGLVTTAVSRHALGNTTSILKRLRTLTGLVYVLLIGVIAFGVALYFYTSQQSLPCLRAKLLTLLRRAFTGLAAFLSIRRRGQRHRWRSAMWLRDHIAAERQLRRRLTCLDRARHQQCGKSHIDRHLRPPSMCLRAG